MQKTWLDVGSDPDDDLPTKKRRKGYLKMTRRSSPAARAGVFCAPCKLLAAMRGHNWTAVSNPECGLSFSARDLLTRLVRENRAIRGKIETLSEPLWVHEGGYPEPVARISDVRELLQSGFIEFSAKSCQAGEELYKPSKSGIRAAGPDAVADATKSATVY